MCKLFVKQNRRKYSQNTAVIRPYDLFPAVKCPVPYHILMSQLCSHTVNGQDDTVFTPYFYGRKLLRYGAHPYYIATWFFPDVTITIKWISLLFTSDVPLAIVTRPDLHTWNPYPHHDQHQLIANQWKRKARWKD